MKKLIVITACAILFSSCLISQKKEISFHPIVLQAKETSLYSHQINWLEVNTKYLELSRGKESLVELKPALQYLINSLGDKHAHIRLTSDQSVFVYYTGETKDEDTRDSDFVNNVINAPSEFSFSLLESRIGYLRVVGIGGGDVKQQSDQIRKGLIELNKQGVDSWILDLRFNGGGNMEPMISGLAPLLGDGPIAYTVNHKGELVREYSIVNGQFDNWGRIVCEMDALPTIDVNEKVAVLLSRYTVSSGELVAIAFKGRENTIFIGEKTGGYTTGNGYDQVSDDLILVISQDVFADSNKKAYYGKVDVDEYIEFEHKLDLVDDKQINEAIEWLKDN